MPARRRPAEPLVAAAHPPARRTSNARTIVAAAQRVDLTSTVERDRHRKRQQGSDWQDRAWDNYEQIGEIWFAHNFIGNALSRVRLVPAWIETPGDVPQPLDPTDPDLTPEQRAIAEAGSAELARLESPHTVGELMREFGRKLALVGESHLLGEPSDESPTGEAWSVLSSDELLVDDGGWKVKEHPGDTQGRPIDPDSQLVRIWRRHPRWSVLPDSPMRAVNLLCEELLLLTRAIRASGMSRLSAGILKLPSELTFPSTTTDGDSGEDPDVDPFTADLIAAMTTPISDPESAAAVVPMIVRGPAEALKELGRLDMTRTIDDTTARQRDELLRRIAGGIDLPAEILLGMADANHWTAWQIDESTFKSHLEPLVVAIVSSLTTGFYRPNLTAAGVDPTRTVVWYDESDLIGHANEFDEALAMHTAGVVSDAYLRRKGGATDADAPEPGDVTSQPAPDGPAAPDGPPGDAADVEAGPPAEALTAASEAALIRLGRDLMAIDRALRLRVQQASDDAVRRMLDRAGAKLRRRAQSDKQLAVRLRGIPNDLVPHTIGRRVLAAQFGVDEREVVDGELGALAALFAAWSRNAYQQARRKTERALGVDAGWWPPDAEQEAERSISAGWAFLSGALVAVATSRLFAPQIDAPTVGEFDVTRLVDAGTVREALALAGGAPAAKPTGAENFAGPAGRPSGGVATGDLVLNTFASSLGAIPVGWQWVYGDAGSRTHPFEPHEALDGVAFSSWDDERLINPDTFPDVEFYAPGDHNGCQCDFVPILEMGDSVE